MVAPEHARGWAQQVVYEQIQADTSMLGRTAVNLLPLDYKAHMPGVFKRMTEGQGSVPFGWQGSRNQR